MKLVDWQSNVLKSIKPTKSISSSLSHFKNNADVEELNWSINRNTVLASLQKWLEAIYPLTLAMVGDNYFKKLSYSYVTEVEPYVLIESAYGKKFPNYLSHLTKAEKLFTSLPYLSDLAKLDWARHQSYYAKERVNWDHLNFLKLTPIEQSCVTFVLHEDIFLIQSNWNLEKLLLLIEQETDTCNLFELKAPCYILIERTEMKVKHYILNQQKYHLLSRLNEGQTLAEIASNHEILLNEFAACIQNGWISHFDSHKSKQS